jgi:uncharacterized membrane protein
MTHPTLPPTFGGGVSLDPEPRRWRDLSDVPTTSHTPAAAARSIASSTHGRHQAGTGKWTNPLTLPGKTLLFLMLSGLATGASWVCYFRALKVGDASKVAPVDKLSVVLVAVFAVVFLNERPSVREWLGILMIGGGVLILAIKR